MDKFCREQLSLVNHDEWRDELYVLRHSPAARRVFAKMQYYMALMTDCDERNHLELFMVASELSNALQEFSFDVATHHPIAYHPWNPRRIWVPGIGKFMELAKVIGFEKKKDEYGETFIKTIDGWWMV